MHKIDLNLAEIVKLAEESDNEDHAAAIIKEHWGTRVRDFFIVNFNPDYQFLLPVGRPEFRYSNFYTGEREAAPVALISELRTLPYFLSFRGTPMREVSDAKRQKLFVQILETVSNSEADLLCRLKEKSIGSKSLTIRALSLIDPKTFQVHQEIPGLS